MTVSGPIDPSQLGFTLMHEHVLSDIRKFCEPTYYTPATEVGLWDQELTLANLHLATEFKPILESALYSDEKLSVGRGDLLSGRGREHHR